MTSIASSATLVSTTPLFVALFGHYCLGEQLPRTSWPGILLVIAGSCLVAENDFALSKEALSGDLLALAGALAAAGYLLAGRFVRRTLDLATYTLGAYGSAALFLLAFSLSTTTPLSGFSNQTYLVFLLLAVIPQLIGHTTFNWTLGFLSPTTVAVLILGEPIGATLLAYWFFEETLVASEGHGAFHPGNRNDRDGRTRPPLLTVMTRSVTPLSIRGLSNALALRTSNASVGRPWCPQRRYLARCRLSRTASASCHFWP